MLRLDAPAGGIVALEPAGEIVDLVGIAKHDDGKVVTLRRREFVRRQVPPFHQFTDLAAPELHSACPYQCQRLDTFALKDAYLAADDAAEGNTHEVQSAEWRHTPIHPPSHNA